MVIKAESGKWKQIIDQLKSIKQIKQISSLTGIFDIMVEIHVNEMEELNEIMINKIDMIEGITNTNTFIVLKDYK
ncbi:MAG: Lrp/AsnC family transcriptional regulator [Candidatus Helarchaeota archaeon]